MHEYQSSRCFLYRGLFHHEEGFGRVAKVLLAVTIINGRGVDRRLMGEGGRKRYECEREIAQII